MTKRGACVISTALLVLIGMVGLSAIHARRSAERFVSRFSSLTIDMSTASDVEALAREFGAAKDCMPDGRECSYWVIFENTWLRRLQLAPRTRLVCTLSVRGGRLSGRHFLYSLWDGDAPQPHEVVLWEPREPVDSRWVHGQWSGGLWRMYVNVKANADASQHRIAYSLNLSCLSKIGGCAGAESLLPSAVPLVK